MRGPKGAPRSIAGDPFEQLWRWWLCVWVMGSGR